MGRQRKFDREEVMKRLCEWVANGQTLRQFCRDNDICYTTVYDWMNTDHEFEARFARARDIGHDVIAEEALAIANEPLIGIETEEEGDKVKIKRGDMLGHRKLQIETRLKLLAKWNPKKYGDMTKIEHSGGLTLEALVAGIDNGTD